MTVGIHKYGVILGLFVLLLTTEAHAREYDPRSSSEFYQNSFGLVKPLNFPLALRVSNIFQKLLKIVDKAKHKDPRILLVDSDNWPWAIALPDNTIIITRGAVEVCYQDVSVKRGDARMAMILGHELGHLAEDDYWHRDIYLSLSNLGETGTTGVLQFVGEQSGLLHTESEQWEAIVRNRELKADDKGFIYSAIAGFEPSQLSTEKDQSFFHYWVLQTTGASQDDSKHHLSAQDRATYLQARFKTLSNIPTLYQLGKILVQMRHFAHAEKIFRKILAIFPAHEVYNNLGYINLITSSHMAGDPSSREYWLPVRLDFEPQTPILTRGIDPTNTRIVEDPKIRRAIDYFTQAIKQNPSYLQAHLNLATTYYLLGKYSNATATLKEALTTVQQNIEAQSMLQITIMKSLEGSINYLPVAIDKLETLARHSDSPLSLSFNLAQLYEKAGQSVKAKPYWERVNSSIDKMPEKYRHIAIQHSTDQTMIAHLDTGVDKKLELYFNNFAKLAELDDSQANPDTNTSLPLDILIDGQMLNKVALSQAIVEYSTWEQKLVKIREIPGRRSISELTVCCGPPKERRETNLGNLWVYSDKWVVLTKNHEIYEAWENQ